MTGWRHFGRKFGYWSYKIHRRPCSIVHFHNDVIPVFALCNAAYSYHTVFSATSIDHISMKKSNKENDVLNTLYGMFYCDISDHLPCFIFLQYANNSLYKKKTNDWNIWRQKLFQVCKNWNDKYMDTEGELYHRSVNTVHQISEQYSRWCNLLGNWLKITHGLPKF